MLVTRQELINSRAKILQEMDKYIFSLNSETILMWLSFNENLCTSPCTNKDYMAIVRDDEKWNRLCGFFGRLVKKDKNWD